MQASDWIALSALALAVTSFVFSLINKHKQKNSEINQDKLIQLNIKNFEPILSFSEITMCKDHDRHGFKNYKIVSDDGSAEEYRYWFLTLQNNGNATAKNIYIRDIQNPDLEINSCNNIDLSIGPGQKGNIVLSIQLELIREDRNYKLELVYFDLNNQEKTTVINCFPFISRTTTVLR